jgi:hypothetical protein
MVTAGGAAQKKSRDDDTSTGRRALAGRTD